MKHHWLGPNYTREGVAGNDITRTNVNLKYDVTSFTYSLQPFFFDTILGARYSCILSL